MSNQSQSTALALQDILLGIADSLNQAQQQLRNMPPFDEYGRPNTMYQLPYLDFNLEVTSEFTSVVTNNPATPNMLQNRIMFKALANPNTSTSNASSNQIVSTISGRFVSVLPNEGLPQVVLECKNTSPVLQNGVYVFDLEAKLYTVNGEVYKNTRVEFNFDALKSKSINGVELQAQPIFTIKEGNTNLDGILTTKIKLSSTDYNSGHSFLFVINSGPLFQTISISK
jgi:hypothetical protein